MESLLARFASDEEEAWDNIDTLNDNNLEAVNEQISKLKKKVSSQKESDKEDEGEEEDDYEEDGEEDFDEDDIDFDELDDEEFDNLDPKEQLKLLMKPVEDEPGFSDEDEDEDEDDFDEDEEDEDEDDLAGKKKKSVKFDLLQEQDSADESEQEEVRPKSNFEVQQARLKRTIAQFEAENVGEKGWAMRGEVTATRRPADSLLQEDLEFEHVAKLAPTITEEVTDDIEAIIKRRIKDGAWDDVERIPEDLQKEALKKRAAATIELNDEKSKMSLADQYEADFQAKRAKTTTSSTRTSLADEAGLDEATRAAHEECRRLFGKLCKALDEMSENKFAPRAYELAEIDIKTIKK